ncbi:MAG: hypothetical protein JZU49_00125 [Sulfuricurvum sp.]|nr:hypothetical protein [Sulfuricurvum sp.]
MKNLPKFLHLANGRAAPGREFILHTSRPAWLAEVFQFDNEEQIIEFGRELTEKAYKPGAPTFIASRSRKPWNGKHYFFAVIALYENFDSSQTEADRVARIARRMADWYLFNVLKQSE